MAATSSTGRRQTKRQTGRRRSTFSAGPLSTPEQRAFQARVLREQEAFDRYKNNLFRFWRECRDKRCRRARACAGAEPNACFRVNWEALPEVTKQWFRAVMTARAQGHPPREAARIADADVRRWVEAQMTLALRKQAPEHSPAPAPAALERSPDNEAAHPGPRVRCP